MGRGSTYPTIATVLAPPIFTQYSVEPACYHTSDYPAILYSLLVGIPRIEPILGSKRSTKDSLETLDLLEDSKASKITANIHVDLRRRLLILGKETFKLVRMLR
jgi:hypothetical protein